MPFARPEFDVSTVETEIQDGLLTSLFKPITILRSKVIVIGDAECGKTSLIQSFVPKRSQEKYAMTSEIDLSVGQVAIPEINCTVDLFIYDIPGQDMFNQEALKSSLWNEANYIVLCYDVSNCQSFDNCAHWIKSISLCKKDVQVLLVANKADLREDNEKECLVEVDASEGTDYAEKHGYDYFECSAMDSSTAKLPFKHMASNTCEGYVQKLQKEHLEE